MLYFPYDKAVIYANFAHSRYATFVDWEAAAFAATGRLVQWITDHPNPGKGESLPVENELYRALKDSLKEYFYGKCAYCESEFDAVAWGDVEHYRPKRRVTGEVHRGYYWLAYAPRNLMPSCQRCNQGEGKSNKFPITGTRACDENCDLAAELPLLLDPYGEADCGSSAQHLRYLFERADWDLLPTGRIEGLTPKGIESVQTYDLNRKALVKRRRKSQEAALTALRCAYGTAAFETKWDDLFATEQEHAAAIRAACEEWLNLQEERLRARRKASPPRRPAAG